MPHIGECGSIQLILLRVFYRDLFSCTNHRVVNCDDQISAIELNEVKILHLLRLRIATRERRTLKFDTRQSIAWAQVINIPTRLSRLARSTRSSVFRIHQQRL